MSIAVYNALTADRTRFVRVDELCRLAVEKGHLPDPGADAARALKEKKGLEKAQGAFLAEILADPVCGAHLCHAMLLPHPDMKKKFDQYEKVGEIDLGGAHLRREGKAAVITMKNPA